MQNRLSDLSPEKRELLEALLRKKRAAAAGAAVIPPRGCLAGPYPLSFAQERLWLSHQLDARSPMDNMAIALRFAGRLDAVALRRSLAAIERRHETLRTRFVVHDGAPAQVIGPAAGLLPWIDLEALPAPVREAEAGALCAAAVLRPFDLERGPLFGATLLRLAGGDHILLCGMHHIVSDGWSIRVFAREVGLLYAAFASGDGAEPLPPLPIQYVDFALWQRRTPGRSRPGRPARRLAAAPRRPRSGAGAAGRPPPAPAAERSGRRRSRSLSRARAHRSARAGGAAGDDAVHAPPGLGRAGARRGGRPGAAGGITTPCCNRPGWRRPFWIEAAWLWSEPLPSTLACLREILA